MSGSSPLGLADTLRVKLGLNDTETRILCRLLAWRSIAREQVCAIASVKSCSLSAIVSGLRRKLAKHDIQLKANYKIGWDLCQEDRKKLFKLFDEPDRSAAA